MLCVTGMHVRDIFILCVTGMSIRDITNTIFVILHLNWSHLSICSSCSLRFELKTQVRFDICGLFPANWEVPCPGQWDHGPTLHWALRHDTSGLWRSQGRLGSSCSGVGWWAAQSSFSWPSQRKWIVRISLCLILSCSVHDLPFPVLFCDWALLVLFIADAFPFHLLPILSGSSYNGSFPVLFITDPFHCFNRVCRFF